MFVQPTSLQGCVYVTGIRAEVSYPGSLLKLRTFYAKGTIMCYTHNSIKLVSLSHKRHYNSFFLLSFPTLDISVLKWQQNMWTGVPSTPAVYHPSVRHAKGFGCFNAASRITPVFPSCPRRKADAFNMPIALLYYYRTDKYISLLCLSYERRVIPRRAYKSYRLIKNVVVCTRHLGKGRSRWQRFRKRSASPNTPYDRSFSDKKSRNNFMLTF